MKKFFEEYGKIIVTAVVAISLIAVTIALRPVVQNNLDGLIGDMSNSMGSITISEVNVGGVKDDVSSSSTPTPYAEQILSVNKLYDVGEDNLTSSDIVTINGIECYVLKIENDNAKLITKNVYNQKFSETNSGTSSTEQYPTSDLMSFNNDFYSNELGGNPYIIDAEVEYLYSGLSTGPELTRYPTYYILQKVFALEPREANLYKNKFSTNINEFWVAGSGSVGGYSNGFVVRSGRELGVDNVNSNYGNARPVFWIKLKEKSENIIKANRNSSNEEIKSVQTLYDVGEENLTINDVVKINGVNCYVLEFDEINNKAKLITQYIYNQKMSTTNTGAEEECKYPLTKLKEFMDIFYTQALKSDSRILNSEVKYLFRYGSGSYNMSDYTENTINQHVFALEGSEGYSNKDKFDFPCQYLMNMDGTIATTDEKGYNFLLAGGCINVDFSNALEIANYGSFGYAGVTTTNRGARPAFWITLD